MKYVLVIEDNEGDIELLQTVSSILNREEKLIPVLNGEGVHEAIYNYRPYLILMDINLPGRSGLSILKEVRDKDFRNPVIVLSSSSNEEDILLAYRHGANAYIKKPYGVGELLETVEAIFKFWDTARVPNHG